MPELERRVAAALHLGDPIDASSSAKHSTACRGPRTFSICPWDADFEEFVDGATKYHVFFEGANL
jgi:hypothetical protein